MERPGRTDLKLRHACLSMPSIANPISTKDITTSPSRGSTLPASSQYARELTPVSVITVKIDPFYYLHIIYTGNQFINIEYRGNKLPLQTFLLQNLLKIRDNRAVTKFYFLLNFSMYRYTTTRRLSLHF